MISNLLYEMAFENYNDYSMINNMNTLFNVYTCIRS